MKNFEKVIRIGTVVLYTNVFVSLFCKIKYVNDEFPLVGEGVRYAGRLSITGVEGPMANGNAKGSCGQIDMHEWEFKTFADGWNEALVKQFRAVWKKWHLNDMKEGSQVQEDFLEKNPIPKEDYAYPKSHYVVVREVLAAVGLNPDPEGYKYGSAWKRQEVPEEVLVFLKSLPDADKQPAWV